MLLQATTGTKRPFSITIETTRVWNSERLAELHDEWPTVVAGSQGHPWEDGLITQDQMRIFDQGSVTFTVPEGAICTLDVGSRGSIYLASLLPLDDKRKESYVTRHKLVTKTSQIFLLRSGQTIGVFQAGRYWSSVLREMITSHTLLAPYDVVSVSGLFALVTEPGHVVAIKQLGAKRRA